jgi:hypothetical protein
MRKILVAVFSCFFLFNISSQDIIDRLDIFIDCQFGCDFTYIRQNIEFVNFMQDRFQADVFVLATRLRTGSGGREIQLVFSGNDQFVGMDDTISYQLIPEATDAIEREALVKNVKRGLLPYLLETQLADNITFEIEGVEKEEEKIVEDPWNFWVFNIGGNANLEGEAQFNSASFSTRFSASRVTGASKISVFGRYNYEEGNFDLGDGEEFKSIIERYFANMRYVLSIDDHWSAGFNASVGSSTFGNTDIEGSFRPAIEYNYYPYEEAATRRFSFNYSIGPEYKDYTDTTVYDKLEETIIRHRLDIEFSQTQKWGELEIDAGVSQYLHDPSLYSMFINPNLEWIITGGLRLNIGGVISFVGDRINIAKADLSDEEILLQVRQLDTDYRYFTYVGFNYRFGSKYNNYVNPRF